MSASEDTASRIKRLAREQMAKKGTAGLSLRGIARQMNVTAPAIYNYFSRLDDLITALLIDAFNGLGDAVAAAAATHDDPARQMMAAGRAYRTWALAHPAEFQLMYGNPIPGYEAPAEVTIPLAARPQETFYRCLLALYEADRLTIPAVYATVPDFIAAHVTEHVVSRFPVLADYPLSLFYMVQVLWSRLHGIVMLEIFEHVGPTLGDVESFYITEIHNFLRQAGIDIT